MATIDKAARGTKRTCQSCESKFYDLNRDPIVCPVCGTVYELAPVQEEEVVPAPVAAKPDTAPVKSETADGEAVDEDDALVSLEDADAELGADDDDSDDDTFLADDDDDDTGVGDLIGGVEKEEDES